MLINKPQWRALRLTPRLLWHSPQLIIDIFRDTAASSDVFNVTLFCKIQERPLHCCSEGVESPQLSIQLRWVFSHPFLPALSLGVSYRSIFPVRESFNCSVPCCDTPPPHHPPPSHICSGLGFCVADLEDFLYKTDVFSSPILICLLSPRSGLASFTEGSLVGLWQGNAPSSDFSSHP